MNPTMPDLTRDLPTTCQKRPRVHRPRRLIEVAQSSSTNPSSLSFESPRVITRGITIAEPEPEPEHEPELGPLSRLIRFPDLVTPEDSRTLILRKSFAQDAESVKRTVLKRLSTVEPTNMTDVEIVIDFVNAAFESLISFCSDFGHLYDAAKIFISHHCKLLHAKSELEKSGRSRELLARKASLAKHSSEAAKMRKKAKIALGRSSSNAASLSRQIEETRVRLDQLFEKLTAESEKVCALKLESDKLEKIYAASRVEHEVVIKKIEEKNAMEKSIIAKRDLSIARIQNIKTVLANIYWDLD